MSDIENTIKELAERQDKLEALLAENQKLQAELEKTREQADRAVVRQAQDIIAAEQRFERIYNLARERNRASAMLGVAGKFEYEITVYADDARKTAMAVRPRVAVDVDDSEVAKTKFCALNGTVWNPERFEIRRVGRAERVLPRGDASAA